MTATLIRNLGELHRLDGLIDLAALDDLEELDGLLARRGAMVSAICQSVDACSPDPAVGALLRQSIEIGARVSAAIRLMRASTLAELSWSDRDRCFVASLPQRPVHPLMDVEG